METASRIDINMPLISIIVPLYNAEKYIETCINSILTQTFQNFEVIVVDDCSTDRSLEIVRNYQDPRIKIIHQFTNSGESSSRNLGLANARGKYVYFMDDDDAILENNLENFYRAAEESNADVVHMNSWLEIADEDFLSESCACGIKHSSNTAPRFLQADIETRLQNEFLNAGVSNTPWTKFSRRDFLIESGLHFPNTSRNGDFLHLFGELCFARKIQVINACGYLYRSHVHQTMRQPLGKHIYAALESIPAAIEFVHQVFASKKLISPISKQFQSRFERNIVTDFFSFYLCALYRSKVPQEVIDQIFREILYQPKMMNPEFMRVLVDIIAFDYASK